MSTLYFLIFARQQTICNEVVLIYIQYCNRKISHKNINFDKIITRELLNQYVMTLRQFHAFYSCFKKCYYYIVFNLIELEFL